MFLKNVDIYKKLYLKLQSIEGNFGFPFFVLLYMKWLITWTYISILNIGIGTVLRNPKMLKFVPVHLKAKKMCKHAVKNLAYDCSWSI